MGMRASDQHHGLQDSEWQDSEWGYDMKHPNGVGEIEEKIKPQNVIPQSCDHDSYPSIQQKTIPSTP